MNDLMTKSFLSYVELKKQAQKDLEADFDIERGQLNPKDEENLTQFFQEVDAIKDEMEEITNLFDKLNEYDCVLQYSRSGRIAVTRSKEEATSDYLHEREQEGNGNIK